MRKRALVVALGISCLTGSAYALFGEENAALVALLSKQLAAIQEGLRTANKTLGSINALRKGIDRIRHYSIDRFKEDFLYSNREINGIRREWRTLHDGGYYYSSDIRRLPALLDQIYGTPSHILGKGEVPGKSTYATGVAKDGMLSGAFGREVRAGAARKQGEELFAHAKRASSPAEAEKVSAEGTGLLLQIQADQMAIQSQQLEVDSAHLQIAAQDEFERMRGDQNDRAVMEHSFRKMGPLR